MSLRRFEKALLESGRRDEPSPERKRAARAAMLRAVALGSAAAAATTTTAATASVTATTAKPLVTGSIGFATKLVLVLGVTATLGGAVVVASRPAPVPAAVFVPPGNLAVVPHGSAPAITSTVTEDAPHDEPTARGVDVHAIPEVRPSLPPPARTAPPDPLAVEVALLEAARACLARGDHACAKARLDEHAARFDASAPLADEAALLAIDLAVARDDTPAARRLAAGLVAKRPNGTWPSRVRALAAANDEDETK